MTTQTEAFKRYLDDCDKHAIVPDVAGAFNFAWRESFEQQSNEQVKPVAVPQFRIQGSTDWYDGYPDYLDGADVYETRTLYTHPPTPWTAKQIKEYAQQQRAQLPEAPL